MTETDEQTRIVIGGPLPMGVAGALMQMIGAAWPEAMIETNTGLGTSMSVLVPAGQPAKTIDQEFVDQIRKDAEGDGADGVFHGFRDGWVAFAPPEELQLELGQIAHAIMEATEGAINHVEWTVRTGPEPDDPGYVLSISRSKGQTPLAMRKAAEARVAQLEKLLVKNKIEVPK